MLVISDQVQIPENEIQCDAIRAQGTYRRTLACLLLNGVVE